MLVKYSTSEKQRKTIRSRLPSWTQGEWLFFDDHWIYFDTGTMFAGWNSFALELEAYLRGERPDWDSLPFKAPIPEKVSNIAQEATELVCGPRNEAYGPPSADYQRTAAAWSGLLIHKLKPGETIAPREAMLMMATLKICREMTNPKRDNRVDCIGYVLCEDWEVTGIKPTPLSKQ